MPAYSSSNNASTTLSAAITTTGATSMSVTSAAAFPASGDYVIQIDTELLLITAGQGTTTWTVSRGVESSSAATHLINAPVTLIWTTATLLSWGGGDGAGGGPGYWTTLAPVGLTGATAASAYVGATNSGAPASGTFAVGQWTIDRSGQLWICTSAGTPGTWAGLLAPGAHWLSTAPGPPTTSGLAAALSSATLGSGSTDTRGTLNLVMGASTPITPGTQLITVTFATAYANANYAVVLSGDNQANNSGVAFSPDHKLAASFGVWLSGTGNLLVGNTYSLDYIVLG